MDFNYDFNYKNVKHVCFNLTNQCNCRCIYCFTHHNPRRMSLETFKQAIVFCKKELGIEQGTFFGGEPMLEYDSLIVPIVKWCEENNINIKWGMTTNGTLFTEERLKWLKEHNVGFLLSIDGDKETQDYNRPTATGGSSFDLIMPHLNTIVTEFPGITFRSTVTPKSAHNLLKDYLFARKMGFRYYYMVPDCLTDPWTKEDLDALFTGYSMILEIMYRDITNSVSPLIVSQFIKSVRTVMPHLLKPDLPDDKPTIYRCGLGVTSLGISPEGYISACQEHATYEQGETPFFIGDIYNGIDKEKHKKLLEMVKKTDHVTNKNIKCNNCPNKSVCASQYCPSHNWLNNNDINTQDDITCMWTIFQNQCAILLLDKAARENNGLFAQFLADAIESGKY